MAQEDSPGQAKLSGVVQVPSSSPLKSPVKLSIKPNGLDRHGGPPSATSNGTKKRPLSAMSYEEAASRRDLFRNNMNGPLGRDIAFTNGGPPSTQAQPSGSPAPAAKPPIRRAGLSGVPLRGAAAAAAAAAASNLAASGPAHSQRPAPSQSPSASPMSPDFSRQSDSTAQQMRQNIQGFRHNPQPTHMSPGPIGPYSPSTNYPMQSPGNMPVQAVAGGQAGQTLSAQDYYTRANSAAQQYNIVPARQQASMASQYDAGRPRQQKVPMTIHRQVGQPLNHQQQQQQRQHQHQHQQRPLPQQARPVQYAAQAQPQQRPYQPMQQVGHSTDGWRSNAMQQGQATSQLQLQMIQHLDHQQHGGVHGQRSQNGIASSPGEQSMSQILDAAVNTIRHHLPRCPDHEILRALQLARGDVENAYALLNGDASMPGAPRQMFYQHVPHTNHSSVQDVFDGSGHAARGNRPSMADMQAIRAEQMRQQQQQQQMQQMQQMQTSTRRDIKAPNLTVQEKQQLRNQQANLHYRHARHQIDPQMARQQAEQRQMFQEGYRQRKIDRRLQMSAAAADYAPPTLRTRKARQLQFDVDSDDESEEGSEHVESDQDSAADGESEDELDRETEVYLEINRQDSEHRVYLFFHSVPGAKELADVASCSEESAQFILDHKPFASLDHVRALDQPVPGKGKGKARNQNRKTTGQKIVDTCIETLEGFSAIDQLMSRCTEYGREIAAAIQAWGVQPDAREGAVAAVKLDEISGESEIQFQKEQPKLLPEDVRLKEYQIFGVNWINLMYTKQLSGILADEMGLGKTCQVISFLGTLLERGRPGPHLVVVPASTLENWLRELSRFCPALKVEAYYGTQLERAAFREQFETNAEDNKIDFNVMVTTYQLAAGSHDDRAFLRRRIFDVCIYDEGHNLKNSSSQRYRYLMQIKASFRLLLTGTPLQNNLKELISLLAFVLPMVFRGNFGRLEEIFKIKALSDTGGSAILSAQRITRAKAMMTPFILRRYKHQVLGDLPAKKYRTDYVELNMVQKSIYNDIVAQTRREMLESEEAGAVSTNGKAAAGAHKAAANTMMQLRKCANHPMLFRKLYDDRLVRHIARGLMREDYFRGMGSEEGMIIEDMSVMTDFEVHRMCLQYSQVNKYALREQNPWMDCGKVAHLAKILPEMRANGDRILLFSQFTQTLDILEKVLDTLELSYFRLDGSTDVTKRQDMIDQFHDETDIAVFLLSTKAGGFGINLACANVVIIYDSSFNPHDDKQAEDRAHRVGQQREVQIVRLVTKDTIEEHIQQLAHTKLALDQSVSGQELSDNRKVEELGEKKVIQTFMDSLRTVQPAAKVIAPKAEASGVTEVPGGEIPAAAKGEQIKLETQSSNAKLEGEANPIPVTNPPAEATESPDGTGTVVAAAAVTNGDAAHDDILEAEAKDAVQGGTVAGHNSTTTPEVSPEVDIEAVFAAKRPVIESDTEDEAESVPLTRRRGRRGAKAFGQSASAGTNGDAEDSADTDSVILTATGRPSRRAARQTSARLSQTRPDTGTTHDSDDDMADPDASSGSAGANGADDYDDGDEDEDLAAARVAIPTTTRSGRVSKVAARFGSDSPAPRIASAATSPSSTKRGRGRKAASGTATPIGPDGADVDASVDGTAIEAETPTATGRRARQRDSTASAATPRRPQGRTARATRSQAAQPDEATP